MAPGTWDWHLKGDNHADCILTPMECDKNSALFVSQLEGQCGEMTRMWCDRLEPSLKHMGDRPRGCPTQSNGYVNRPTGGSTLGKEVNWTGDVRTKDKR